MQVLLFVVTLNLHISFACEHGEEQSNFAHNKYTKLTTDFETGACSPAYSGDFQDKEQVGENKEVHINQFEEKATKCNLPQDEMERKRTNQEKITTSLAVVPYDESKVLPHEKSSRQFDLAGHSFTIHQDWHGLGVAAVVWDSALVLAEYLHAHKYMVEGKKVLELGAGTGLTGLVSAALGADVIMTERKEAMAHLTSSVKNNTVGKQWKITCKTLDWTDNTAFDNLTSFDVILGADIIYIEETFNDLLRTIISVAPSNKVLILLSCRLRYDRDTNFLDMLKEHFDVTEIFFDKEKKIKIFSVRRKNV